MTVYVDDMHAMELGRFGRMRMSHMVADTDEELHKMADRIGVLRKWHQKPGTARSHYDIAMSKRALAVAAGAIEVKAKVLVAMTKRREITGELGSPEDALPWYFGQMNVNNEVKTT